MLHMRGVAGDSLTLFQLLTETQWSKLMSAEYMTDRLEILLNDKFTELEMRLYILLYRI